MKKVYILFRTIDAFYGTDEIIGVYKNEKLALKKLDELKQWNRTVIREFPVISINC